ncbi:diguanylate cyclase (GGDEF)-like protein/PAS domain S-box-containing protein [Oceanisphaera litoralis]|uniref:sensor domain-containing phosphodiesterase n=1 Tax=Oceanisphaera litoralis TaxID=225144 RepID=UPI00195A1F68|nr:EAL domain-containing protein [Oceanisphaera litoralis]MBM7454316.1 diguanylate cyclase (GGDEF)-like protein/PAS domain S-box-containing protein [Oceanisphaera litoralis]
MQLPAVKRPQHHLCFFSLDPRFCLAPLTALPVDDIRLPDADRSLLCQLDDNDRRQLERQCATGHAFRIGLTIEGRRWQCHLAPAENSHWLLSAEMGQTRHDDSLGLLEWQLQQHWEQEPLSLAARIPMLMDTLVGQQEADRVILWRHYPAEELLRPLYSQGLPFSLQPVKAERRYLRTLQQRGGLSYSHCSQQPLLGAFSYLTEDGIQHRLDVPLLVDNTIVGLLSLECRRQRSPVTPSDMQFVSMIADRLAEVIAAPSAPEPVSDLDIDIDRLTPVLSRHTGQDFFNQLMQQLATLCGADIALVGLQHYRQDKVRVLSCYMDEQLQPPFSYQLTGSPCHFSVEPSRRACVFHNRVAEQFPDDQMLQDKGIRAYIGLSIKGPDKHPIGILALLFKQPQTRAAAVQSLLEQLESRVRDELLRRRDQEALMVAAAAFDAQEGLVIADSRMQIQCANRAFSHLSGYEREQLTNRSFLSLRAEDPDNPTVEVIFNAMEQQHRWQGEQRLLRADGRELPVSIRISQVRDGLGITHHVCCVEDISGQKADKQRIEQMAYFDELTGLHNRRFMVAHIADTVIQAELNASRGALLLLDLDDFKNINDSLGYATGDDLLVQVAERLNTFAGQVEGASLARISSDEFVLLCPDLSHGYTGTKTRAEQLAQSLRELFILPFQLGKLRLHLSASIGISLFPVANLELEEYMRQADTANHIAKRVAPGSHVFFSQEMADEVKERLRISNALQQALANNELALYFQPQQQVKDNRQLGIEVLLRWLPPGKQPISPAHFIPIAEETSLICDLGDWVLQQACSRIQAWQAGGLQPGRVSVNISARHFHNASFVSRLSILLLQYPACRNTLTLEVTEGVILENLQESRTRMTQIKALGVNLSIDDFGTGYSSFAYLRELPVDELKLDRSFIQHIDKRPQDRAIIACLLELARTLQLSVVAEGVETESQLATLAELHCPAYQGYLRARPMPEADLLRWLANQ